MSTPTPYVMVQSAKAFVSFITHAFDAEVSNVVPLPADPDRVLHAEARIGTGVLFFADSGANGESAPTPPESAHVQLSCPTLTRRSHARRMGGFVDAFSALWWVSTSQPGGDTLV